MRRRREPAVNRYIEGSLPHFFADVLPVASRRREVMPIFVADESQHFFAPMNHPAFTPGEIVRVTPSFPQRGRQPKGASPLDPLFLIFTDIDCHGHAPRGELRRVVVAGAADSQKSSGFEAASARGSLPIRNDSALKFSTHFSTACRKIAWRSGKGHRSYPAMSKGTWHSPLPQPKPR